MFNIISVWFAGLWAAMESDIAFAVICGIILVAAQVVNAGFGIWRNNLEGDKFSLRVLIRSILEEVSITAAAMGTVALLYMLANLAGMSILPGFEVGDLPTLTILVAFGALVIDKVMNIAKNLILAIDARKIKDVVDIQALEEED